ncbi:RNA polymerase sigma factor, partial [Streptomyces sp. SID5926]|nr:RNA polymerase sigma factor [Streptomyces sp. SID5926]
MSASTSRTLPPEIAESVSVMALIERGKAEGQIAGDDVRRAFEADQIPATQWKNVLRSLNQILEEEGVTLMVSAAEPKRTRKSVAAKSPAKRTATKAVAAKPVTSRKTAAPAAPAAPATEPAAVEEEAPAKKGAAKKTTAKKATAKKTTAKKTAAKKTTAKKEDGELLEDEATEEPKAATEEPEGTENAGFVLSDEDEDDAPAQQVAAAGATADPVKDYLKQIGKVPLLNAEQEVELAKR